MSFKKLSLRDLIMQRKLDSAKNQAYSVAEKRAEYKNAYKSWTPEDERILWKLRDERVVRIAELFGRKPSAIISRLQKLEWLHSEKSKHTKIVSILNNLRPK